MHNNSGGNCTNETGKANIHLFIAGRTGGWFNKKMLSYHYKNPIVEIRRSYGRLISTMGFPILVRWHLYIESGLWNHPAVFPQIMERHYFPWMRLFGRAIKLLHNASFQRLIQLELLSPHWWPSDTIRCHRSLWTFVRTISCRLLSTKSLPGPVLVYCQLNP